MDDRREFARVWRRLGFALPGGSHFLTRVEIDGFRGMRDFSVDFIHPVTVLAGENGCGKSTVLFAAACAQDDPSLPKNSADADVLTTDEFGLPLLTSLTPAQQAGTFSPRVPRLHRRRNVPSRLFPSYDSNISGLRDAHQNGKIRYEIRSPHGTLISGWDCLKGRWQKFVNAGRTVEDWPMRQCYLRTLMDIANLSEVLEGSSTGKHQDALAPNELTVDQIKFASSILPHFRYRNVVELAGQTQNVLFAFRDASEYSELQMAAGERVALRFGLEVSQLSDSLILVDEIEAGLHPRAQQRLMLGLQWLAVRQNLQIIVTTHSPVILDCVHPHGRIFLERMDEHNVRTTIAYPDVVQDALYGRPLQQPFRILCEDDAAEGILDGILDYLVPKLRWPRSSVKVSRNTGAEQFPAHVSAFAKCGMLHHFAFVLDGDQRKGKVEGKIGKVLESMDQKKRPIIFLPGDSPEQWTWEQLRSNAPSYVDVIGTTIESLTKSMQDAEAKFGHANSPPSEISKAMLEEVAESVSRRVPEVCRDVARQELEQEDSEMQAVAKELTVAFDDWRDSQMTA